MYLKCLYIQIKRCWSAMTLCFWFWAVLTNILNMVRSQKVERGKVIVKFESHDCQAHQTLTLMLTLTFDAWPPNIVSSHGGGKVRLLSLQLSRGLGLWNLREVQPTSTYPTCHCHAILQSKEMKWNEKFKQQAKVSNDIWIEKFKLDNIYIYNSGEKKTSCNKQYNKGRKVQYQKPKK